MRHETHQQHRGRRDGERGQAIIVAAIAMAALLAITAYAINTAQWWVHSHHLQEQADAAALAGARAYVAGCAQDDADDQTTVNTNIANAVASFDGAGSASAKGISGSSTTVYNKQLNSNGSPITAWINSNTFPSATNTTPDFTATTGNTLTGNPCADGMLDVKLTEQSISSLLPSVNPTYVSAEAQVGFFEETTADDVQPFIFESDTPSYMWVELVDENSAPTTNTPTELCVAKTGPGTNTPCTPTPTPGNPCTRSNDGVNPTVVLAWAYLPAPTDSGNSWTGQLVPCSPLSSGATQVPFTSSASSGTFPVGVRVITSSYSTEIETGATNPYPPQCPMEWGDDHDGGSYGAWAPNGVICYDVGPPNPGLYSTLEAADKLTDDGVSFVRVWSNPSVDVPGSPASTPAAPQASDVWLIPYVSSASQADQCGTTEGTSQVTVNHTTTVTPYSNFFNDAQSVQLCANMTWTTSASGSTAIACSQASMTTYVVPSLAGMSSSSDTMSCPSGGPNGVWYSPPVALTDAVSGADPHPLVTGPTSFALDWTLETGKVPKEYRSSGRSSSAVSGGYDGSCTSSNPCYGSFDGDKAGASYAEVVQRAFDGADSASGSLYQYEASYSRAGPIDGVTLTDTDSNSATDPYSGDYIQSISRNSAANLTATVTLIPGFQDDKETTSAGDPVTLNAGDDDFSGEWDCYEPTYQTPGETDSSADPAWGDPQAFNLELQYWIEKGCNSTFITNASSTTLPAASPPVQPDPSTKNNYWFSVDSSSNSYGPPTCTYPQPDAPSQSNTADCAEGVSDNDILWNIMAGLNQRILGCSNATCSGDTPKCNNYWNTNNTVPNILDAGPDNDKRLVTLAITGYGMMYPSSYEPPPIEIPIIAFAEFYITGWWGDPCADATTASRDATTYTLPGGTVLQSGADDTPPNDTDEDETLMNGTQVVNSNVDSNAYTENSCGQNSGDVSGQGCGTANGQGNSVTCDSATPGYDTALSTGDDCTDQGLLLGHFVQDVVTSGVASSTLCNADTLGICVAVLTK